MLIWESTIIKRTSNIWPIFCWRVILLIKFSMSTSCCAVATLKMTNIHKITFHILYMAEIKLLKQLRFKCGQIWKVSKGSKGQVNIPFGGSNYVKPSFSHGINWGSWRYRTRPSRFERSCPSWASTLALGRCHRDSWPSWKRALSRCYLVAI